MSSSLFINLPFLITVCQIFLWMSCGKFISPYLRTKICEKWDAGLTTKEIADELNISLRSVQRVCQLHNKNQKKRGHPFILSPSDRRRLVHQARQTPTKSASVLAHSIGISASLQTVQQELQRKNFVRVAIRKTP